MTPADIRWWTRALVVGGLAMTATVTGCWSFVIAGEKTDTSPWVVVVVCAMWGCGCGWLAKKAWTGWGIDS